MTRALLLGLALLATACGSKKTPGESLCVAMVPPPAACNTACDPNMASSGCPSGFHCTPDSKCDVSCTQSGGECGTGFMCTADGSCISDGTGSGGPIIDAPDCPAVHFTAKKTTPVVELLLDQSASMNDAYPNMGDPSRWEALRKALIDPTNGVVKKLAGSVIFGAALYSNKSAPTGPGGQQVGIAPCPTLTEKPRALNNFTAIDQLLKADPVEDTPTAESIDKIVQGFHDNPPADPAAPKIILLATDGLPDTCADADPPTDPNNQGRQNAASAASVAAAQRAYAAGIKLFFLFIGNDAAGNHPKQMANAGVGKDPLTGDAEPFLATNPATLTKAFNDIIGGVVSCDLTLSGPVNQTDGPNGMVTLNGMDLVYNTDWTLDPDGLTLHLKGTACDMLKASANPTVNATFPCGAIIF
jgi:hypothetical protein